LAEEWLARQALAFNPFGGLGLFDGRKRKKPEEGESASFELSTFQAFEHPSIFKLSN
jgi:hypothetical protein